LSVVLLITFPSWLEMATLRIGRILARRFK
jgi:hypothetical protein